MQFHHRLSLCKTVAAVLFLFACPAVRAQNTGTFPQALSLYERGLYSQSMDILQNLPGYGNDPEIDGYAALCAVKMKSDNYVNVANNCIDRYKCSNLTVELRRELSLDYFDKGKYNEALAEFDKLVFRQFSQEERAELTFKKGYSLYMTGNRAAALNEFTRVELMDINDYTAPAAYTKGYILYKDASFEEAQSCFEKAAVDERFAPIARYYAVLCHYEKRDSRYVLDEGVKLFGDPGTPRERKVVLARVISESFLLVGDKRKAREYYDATGSGAENNRDDWFYAGFLMYATGDWRRAVDSYANVVTIKDSLSQVAWYQSAFSYLKLKNRLSALDCFREASSVEFDSGMTEDAFFNYAKLAFDLNGDTSVFEDYMKKYSDKARGQQIYSYMALAALSNHNWQGALDAYDKIDELKGADKENYIKANYLRGAQLLDAGSYRNAVQCMKTVAYFTDESDVLNHLARYALGEAYYRNAQYQEAGKQYAELYNNNALFGLPEGDQLSYNAAYAWLREEDYAQAAKWFERYIKEVHGTKTEDASLRRADCLFARKEYKEAAAAYEALVSDNHGSVDLYPRYRSALAYGLIGNNKHKLELLQNVPKAKKSSPYYAEALFELGRTQASLKQTAAASRTFTMLSDNLPGSVFAARAMLELGTIRRNSKDKEGALSCYRKVVEEMPSSGCVDDALLAIESIYQSAGTPEKYLAYLDKVGLGASKSEDERRAMFFAAAEQVFYSGDTGRALDQFIKFRKNYPDASQTVDVEWYIAECRLSAGDKVKACDSYRKVMEGGEGPRLASATSRFAAVSYSLENYAEAARAYASLRDIAGDSSVRLSADMGIARSCFRTREYDKSIRAAQNVINDGSASEDMVREASLLFAKSCLAVNDRDRAVPVLEKLSASARTAEGAEATYLLIQDCFNRADFDGLQKRCFDFGDSGTGHRYFLAKSYILLGDSYMEQGKIANARATFQSIADEYKVQDDVRDAVMMRLDKLNEMTAR